MFESINHIHVDRKNSLPIRDFTDRYKNTGTPVVFGDMTKRWGATKNWSLNYFNRTLGDCLIPLSPSKQPHKPDLQVPMSDYLNLLSHGENNLMISSFNIFKGAPTLMQDFEFPRLRLNFAKRCPLLSIAGKTGTSIMRTQPDLAHLILCHFGAPKHVLLVSGDQRDKLYKEPFSFNALNKLDFNAPDLNEYPAIKKINGYVATLGHGDALYVPSGYWHCSVNEGAGFSLTLKALPNTPSRRLKMFVNGLLIRPINATLNFLMRKSWASFKHRKAVKNAHRAI